MAQAPGHMLDCDTLRRKSPGHMLDCDTLRQKSLVYLMSAFSEACPALLSGDVRTGFSSPLRVSWCWNENVPYRFKYDCLDPRMALFGKAGEVWPCWRRLAPGGGPLRVYCLPVLPLHILSFLSAVEHVLSQLPYPNIMSAACCHVFPP